MIAHLGLRTHELYDVIGNIIYIYVSLLLFKIKKNIGFARIYDISHLKIENYYFALQ